MANVNNVPGGPSKIEMLESTISALKIKCYELEEYIQSLELNLTGENDAHAEVSAENAKLKDLLRQAIASTAFCAHNVELYYKIKEVIKRSK